MNLRRHKTLPGALLIALATAGLGMPGASTAHDDGSHPAYRTDGGSRPGVFEAEDVDVAETWRRGRVVDRMADGIGLSVEQRDAICDLMERSRPATRELRDDMHAKRREMMDTPPDDPNYDEVVQRVAEENGHLISQMLRLHAQLKAEVHALMTPEQRERAREMKRNMRSRIERRLEERLAGPPEILF